MTTNPNMDKEKQELRVLLTEAHQAIKDLRLAMKEAVELTNTIRASAREDVQTILEAEVAKGLEEFTTLTLKHIDIVQKRIDKRFDNIVDRMFGEDNKSRRLNKLSIPELYNAKKELDKIDKLGENYDQEI